MSPRKTTQLNQANDLQQIMAMRRQAQHTPYRSMKSLGPNDVVIAVMGMTGSGKTSFIQQFCEQDLLIGHGLEACTAQVEVVPCTLPTGEDIYLIDTPGFDDTHRSDSEILGEIANWLNESHQAQVTLTGIIYLHRIIDVRLGGAGYKNLRMFRKLCGDRGLGSVALATTMWSLCPPGNAQRREDQLVNQNDLWKALVSHGSKVFRHDEEHVSGLRILKYLVDRARPVVLDIQREMGEQGKSLSATSAGLEVQADLEKLKQEHAQELKDVRKELEEAVKANDVERQAELNEYKAQIDRQMAQAREQAEKLEVSREQLRKEMQAQHAREMEALRSEISRRQQELDACKAEQQGNLQALRDEIQKLREKSERQEFTNNFKYNYNYKMNCSHCNVGWVSKRKFSRMVCHTCGNRTTLDDGSDSD